MVAHASRLYAACTRARRFYRSVGRIVSFMKIAPLNHRQRRATAEIIAIRVRPIPSFRFRPIRSSTLPFEYIDVFLSQFRESDTANWYDKRRRTLVC